MNVERAVPEPAGRLFEKAVLSLASSFVALAAVLPLALPGLHHRGMRPPPGEALRAQPSPPAVRGPRTTDCANTLILQPLP